MGNGKRVLRTGFSNRNCCVPFAQFETRWVFDVNGKQPRILEQQTEVENIKLWSENKRMALNMNKTYEMIVRGNWEVSNNCT